MTEGKSCIICKVVKLLAGVGALNWGLVAFFGLNLVEKALGSVPHGPKAVYGLVGLAGLMTLVSLCKCCPCQKKDGACCPTK